ncbi:MAG: hypothetical protein ACJAX5_000594 [Patiriisocius sp.]|jgi:hypothetical protein
MKYFMSNSLKALSVVALLGAMTSMPASANIGRVLYTFGNVTVEKPAISNLKRGVTVEEGDIVVTGPKGYAQLKLLDGTKIAIRPGSRFVIEAFEAPATATQAAIGEGKALRSSFKLQKGGFRTITGSIARRDPAAYQVTTPSAVIRVRGTNFVARTCAGDCGAGTLDGDYIGVSSGGVNVSNAAGSLDLANNQFGFAQSFNTPPTRLTAPPSSLQDDGLAVLEESEEEGSDEDEGGASAASGDSSEEGGEEGGSGDESTTAIASTRGGAVSSTAAASNSTKSTTTTTAPGDNEPDQEISAAGTGGQNVDLTGGGEETFIPRGLTFAVEGRAAGINTNNETATFDSNNNLTGFADPGSEGQSVTYAIGAAVNRNVGFDPNSSIKWGRWGNGIATQSTNDAAPTNLELDNQSLHWVVVSQDEVVPTQVITGSASYTLVGNTDPTDNLGNVGVLGSANFSADFTNSTVESSLQLGINEQNWTASGSGNITSNLFSGLYGTVSVNGAADGSGSFGGVFGGFSATGVPTGAGMTYQLSNGTATVSGAAVFNNSGAAQ